MSLRDSDRPSASRIWNLRVPDETKDLWAAMAEAGGVSLSEYVRSIVTAHAEDAAAAMVGLTKDAMTPEQIAAAVRGVRVLQLEREEEMSATEVEPQVENDESVDEGPQGDPWQGVLGTIGSPTGDGRYPVPGRVGLRALPVEFHMQPAMADGHDGAVPVGSITEIELIPFAEFERASEFYDEQQIASMSDEAVVVFGRGVLNGDYAEQAALRINNGADVSIDGLRFDGLLYNSDTYEPLSSEDLAELEMSDVFEGIMQGSYLQGMEGDIAGATIVGTGAFKEARVITASGSLQMILEEDESAARRFAVLVASAGPLKPPREWLENPNLKELTPLKITKEGRVFGHLADWNGCHTGFMGVCVPPFHSISNFAYFNVGEIETAEGDLIPCGKLMFSMDGGKHAPVDAALSYSDVQRHYDDATRVGAFVRAGSDRFGTWLAGTLRPGLNDIEIQHLRTHPPSGDWRPIRGGDSDLVAAFSVPIPGFPIPRGQALVASAGGEITAIITAPLGLAVDDVLARRRNRLKEAMGQPVSKKTLSRAEIRKQAADRLAEERRLAAEAAADA